MSDSELEIRKIVREVVAEAAWYGSEWLVKGDHHEMPSRERKICKKVTRDDVATYHGLRYGDVGKWMAAKGWDAIAVELTKERALEKLEE